MRFYLIGFMGSGKSYNGKQLAEHLSYPFMDTDQLIEKEQACTIKEIFEHRGETAFRQLETAILRTTATFESGVIATGGGLPCHHKNMSFMLDQGICIYLHLSQKVLWQRLKEEKSHRPLIADLSDRALEDFIQTKLAERQPIYEKAHHKINAEEAPLEQLRTYLQKLQLK